MKNKYYSGVKRYGDYIVYDVNNDNKNSISYSDIFIYYNVEYTKESEDQKAERITREKAEKRNSKIDQILEK